jgi:hypothetical protein
VAVPNSAKTACVRELLSPKVNEGVVIPKVEKIKLNATAVIMNLPTQIFLFIFFLP